ncbi:hypothetical protein GCM10018954_005550 [Kutzneria kofuensis]
MVFSVTDTVPWLEMLAPLGRLFGLAASPSLVYVQFTVAASGVGRFGAGASAVGMVIGGFDVVVGALEDDAASEELVPLAATAHQMPPAATSTTTAVTEMLVIRRRRAR